MPERIKDYEGPDHEREELPVKRFAQLFKGRHISAPVESRLVYVDGKPRRKRLEFITGPSRYVEDHILDLEWGVEILLPNGHKLMLKSAGKDHIEIIGDSALAVRLASSNVLHLGVDDSASYITPTETEIAGVKR